MFGCSVGDLVGAPVSTIIPAPFNSMHDGFLHSYLQADRPPSFMKQMQHVFASRRNGTIFPVTLRVRQISGGLSGSAFIAVISETKVARTEHFCLYDPASDRVKAVSAGLAALLSIDTQQLGSAHSEYTLARLLPSLPALHGTQASASNEKLDGKIILFHVCDQLMSLTAYFGWLYY